HCFEMISRLVCDWPQLIEFFDIDPDNCQIAKIQNDKGDRHAGGKSVAIITFQSGQHIVYKPRSLKSDVHFQELLDWTGNNLTLGFKTLKILDRGDYGYQEFADYQHCDNVEQIDRFYHRMGYLLAVLYSLNATDFHYENIIAKGEYPMLIDLESLFNTYFIERNTGADEQIFNSLDNSVLSIAMLPAKLQMGGNKFQDLSGMTDVEDKEKMELSFHAEATDEMKVVRKEVKIEGTKNYPKLNWGEKPRLLDYASTILKGFEEAYRMLMSRKDQLLSPDGPVYAFKDDKIRILLRSTGEYTMLSSNGFHPELLTNAIERDSVYVSLYSVINGRPDMEAVVPHEIAAMNRNDVPLFTGIPSDHALYIDGEIAVPDFFNLTGLELVYKKIEGLNNEDMNRQLWIIKASLATSANPEEAVYANPVMPDKQYSKQITSDKLIAISNDIATELEKQSFQSENSVNWVGLNLMKNHYEINPLYLDLYSGLPGVILYLLYHSHCTGDTNMRTFSEIALQGLDKRVRSFLSKKSGETAAPGGYKGMAGCLYVLTHAAALLNDPAYLETARIIANWLDKKDLSDLHADVLKGHAGIILCVKAYHEITRDEISLRVINKCAGYLESSASKMPEGGLGWLSYSDFPLTGLAHGASGVALALRACYELTGDTKWETMATEAIAYERIQRVDKAGNWKDLRKHIISSAPDSYTNMLAWCNGAPGIGIARAAMLGNTRDEALRQSLEEDLKIAVKSTLRHGFGKNHSLCHGDLGNMELLLWANQVWQDNKLEQIEKELLAGIIESIRLNGFLCGTPLNVNIPGMLTGSSGIGYQLLRFAFPHQVPSVLLLEGVKTAIVDSATNLKAADSRPLNAEHIEV
ncbi:MAG: type 2 lanthipeptide synthetase LanM family protein, partial [Cyclobacteriaceae bacterium]